MTESKKSVHKEPKKNKAAKDTTALAKKGHFPIVGIGASAGGLEAMEQFFENMPADNGMAFVVIQHLDPNHTGMMPEILQRHTKMKVVPVTNQLIIKVNCVYVIPPNKSMSILHGALHLFEPIETRGLRLPIDFFFRSLADDCQEKSIGIIFSGMGSDGSLGVKAIKEKAGFVLVQEPSSAKFDSMPRHAIQSIIVDIIAPADELPSKLLNLSKTDSNISSTPRIEKDSSSLDKIIILLRTQTGNDFSHYKINTIYRRIERRMSIHQISKIASYVRYLQENTGEIDILFKELLIGVTNFFRDPSVWQHLRDVVFPKMFVELPHGHAIRAWVPACSTGEEAYSIAIIFKEAIEKTKLNKNLTLQIFATDLDNDAIEQARRGIYSSNISADISPERLTRFFSKSDDQYRMNTEIREMVVFAPQSVIKDPPFTKLDILSCRNMLIYMDGELQKKLLTLFHYSLNHKGIMILGSAETMIDNKDSFENIESKLRIYQKTGALNSDELINFPSAFAQSKAYHTEKPIKVKVSDNIQSLTDNLLLQEFSPASILVNPQGDILYLTGNTGKYLSPAAGKASFNLFTMARKGLRDALPVAFRKALQNYNKLVLKHIKIGANGGTLISDVSIQQIENPLALKGKLLIVFSDVSSNKLELENRELDKPNGDPIHIEFNKEIQRLTEDLQTTREEMQTSQEELKSTNEELQSSNEELQSTNEELTTSKEEMQSLNEELHTVNIELQSKIDHSIRMSNDMSNLLNSSEIATLFLDRDLKIRQFTAHTTKIFKLIKSDIGRQFTDLATELSYPEMSFDAQEVLRTLVFSEKTISSNDGQYYTIRIMPYRTFEDKIDGLVITFINATESKKFEHALTKSKYLLKSFIQNVPSIVIGLSQDGIITDFNPAAEEVFKYKRMEIIGKNYYDMLIPDVFKAKTQSDIKQLFKDDFPHKFENHLKSADGKQLKIVWTFYQLFNEKGDFDGLISHGEKILVL